MFALDLLILGLIKKLLSDSVLQFTILLATAFTLKAIVPEKKQHDK
jgi:hypothetical protein